MKKKIFVLAALFLPTISFAQEIEWIGIQCKIYSSYRGVEVIPFEMNLKKDEASYLIFHIKNEFENHFLTVTMQLLSKITNPGSVRFEEAIYSSDRITMSLWVSEGAEPVEMLGVIPVWDADVKARVSSVMVPKSLDYWMLLAPAAIVGKTTHSAVYCSKK